MRTRHALALLLWLTALAGFIGLAWGLSSLHDRPYNLFLGLTAIVCLTPLAIFGGGRLRTDVRTSWPRLLLPGGVAAAGLAVQILALQPALIRLLRIADHYSSSLADAFAVCAIIIWMHVALWLAGLFLVYGRRASRLGALRGFALAALLGGLLVLAFNLLLGWATYWRMSDSSIREAFIALAVQVQVHLGAVLYLFLFRRLPHPAAPPAAAAEPEPVPPVPLVPPPLPQRLPPPLPVPLASAPTFDLLNVGAALALSLNGLLLIAVLLRCAARLPGAAAPAALPALLIFLALLVLRSLLLRREVAAQRELCAARGISPAVAFASSWLMGPFYFLYALRRRLARERLPRWSSFRLIDLWAATALTTLLLDLFFAYHRPALPVALPQTLLWQYMSSGWPPPAPAVQPLLETLFAALAIAPLVLAAVLAGARLAEHLGWDSTGRRVYVECLLVGEGVLLPFLVAELVGERGLAWLAAAGLGWLGLALHGFLGPLDPLAEPRPPPTAPPTAPAPPASASRP